MVVTWRRKLARALNSLMMALSIAACNDADKTPNGGPLDDPEETPLVVPPAPLPPLPHPLYGVTVDSIDKLPGILESLTALSRRPTARVVFDDGMQPSYYADALAQLHAVSYVMGEIVDSSSMAHYDLEEYTTRTRDYLDAVAASVDIWEIGNEVNGEWLGDPNEVAAKIEAAYRLAEQKGVRTAVTLYYNENCWLYPWEEMFTWAEQHISAEMKSGVDYALISYYEEDCNGLRPDWPAVFQRLATMFPNSYLGFGEIGTTVQKCKAAYLKRYYTLSIDHPAYIGGHFWWYFVQDMVPPTKPLWHTLNTIIAGRTSTIH